MRCVWDDSKNAANQRKHGLSFDEAQKLFAGDGDYLEIFDEAHSEDEDRFVAIGAISRGVVLVVYVELSEEWLRIISARWATKREMQMFRGWKASRK